MPNVAHMCWLLLVLVACVSCKGSSVASAVTAPPKHIDLCASESERIQLVVSLIDTRCIAAGTPVDDLTRIVGEDRLNLNRTNDDGVVYLDLSDRPEVPMPTESYGWTGWYLKVWYQKRRINYFVMCNIHKSLLDVEIILNTTEGREVYRSSVEQFRKLSRWRKTTSSRSTNDMTGAAGTLGEP